MEEKTMGRRIAEGVLIRQGNDIRIQSTKGFTKLLCRDFDSDGALEHRLINAQMVLGGWFDFLLGGIASVMNSREEDLIEKDYFDSIKFAKETHAKDV
jgi:hypothetical protein